MLHSDKEIIVISDGTGKTARRLLDAVLSQYKETGIAFRIAATHPSVVTRKKVDEIIATIDTEQLVVFSIISEELGTYLHESLAERGILHLNVLRPMIKTLSKFLGVHPAYKPGLLYVIDDNYYRKLDAIGFTVEHDDGRGHRTEEADAVLVGLSRTCKTPISMYLSCNFGLKVANIPIIPQTEMKDQLLNRLATVDGKRIVGLMIQANELVRIREERAALLVGGPEAVGQLAQYHDVRTVREELRFCRQLFHEQGWESIDVTRRAIEEITSELLDVLNLPGEVIREVPPT